MSQLTTFRNNLEKLGLDGGEVQMYICALKSPGSSIYDLSKQAKLSKSTGYRVFESLREKGLLRLEENTVYANKLHDFLMRREKERNSMTRAIDSLRDASHLLRYFADNQDDFFLETLRGEDLIERYLDLASYYHWDRILAIGDFEMFMDGIGLGIEESFVKSRLKTGKHATGIFTTNDIYSQEFVRTSRENLRKTTINTTLDMKGHWINIFPEIETTAFFQNDECGLKMTMIKNASIAQTQKALFDNFWNQSRP